MEVSRENPPFAWSDSVSSDSSLTRRDAYNQAQAAYQKLQSVTVGLQSVKSKLDMRLPSSEWSAAAANLLSLRREWNEAFAEFDEAVNSYSNALAIEGYRPPRKPR
jgi:hypothetical protein